MAEIPPINNAQAVDRVSTPVRMVGHEWGGAPGNRLGTDISLELTRPNGAPLQITGEVVRNAGGVPTGEVRLTRYTVGVAPGQDPDFVLVRSVPMEPTSITVPVSKLEAMGRHPNLDGTVSINPAVMDTLMARTIPVFGPEHLIEPHMQAIIGAAADVPNEPLTPMATAGAARNIAPAAAAPAAPAPRR